MLLMNGITGQRDYVFWGGFRDSFEGDTVNFGKKYELGMEKGN